MFTKGEKVALIIAGIEVIFINIAVYTIRRSLANKYGVSIKDLKSINLAEEAKRLRNREA